MSKQLITESDVRALGRGARLQLDPKAIVTPAALDAAFQLGVQLVHAEESGFQGGGKKRECLWHGMLETNGTYIVEVKDGQAVISLLGPDGPRLYGKDNVENHR